jgi:uncharacterized protein (DUF736 family)
MNLIMAVIGNFATNGNGIVGNVRTLSVGFKARLNPIERVSRDAPDFRITAGNGVEVGAGWKAVSNDGEEYISVKLALTFGPLRQSAKTTGAVGANGRAECVPVHSRP